MVAEDLAHETWITLMRYRNTYRVEAKFTTYLFRIAHSRLIDHVRRGKSSLVLENHDSEEILNYMPCDSNAEPENIAQHYQLIEKLVSDMEQLPFPQREVFILRLEQGMTVANIAKTVGVPVETAKSRLRYATAKLMDSLSRFNS
jgi:RNA polymerase sigma-70 factor (ECF subfamily)